MNNIFNRSNVDQILHRIEKLSPEKKPLWGKMNSSQMLAHLSVMYETVYEDIHPKPKGMMKFILKWLIKPGVVGKRLYPKNGRTAPHFIIANERDFEIEKARLITYIEKTFDLGKSYFEQKESHSFGKLSATEWNVLFSKHIEHHLVQFDV